MMTSYPCRSALQTAVVVLAVFMAACVRPTPEGPGGAPAVLDLTAADDLPLFADDMDCCCVSSFSLLPRLPFVWLRERVVPSTKRWCS